MPRGRGGSSCVRFCRSLRWSLNSHVGFGIGGSRDTRTGAGAGAHSPDTSTREPAPESRPVVSRTRSDPRTTRTLVDSFGSCLIQVTLDSLPGSRAGPWALGPHTARGRGGGPRRFSLRRLRPFSCADAAAPARPPRARRLVHVHVELEADANVIGFGCHRVGSGAFDPMRVAGTLSKTLWRGPN